MFKTFHSVIFWVIISMIFLLVMSVLVVVTTYQSNVRQQRQMDILARQKESISNLYFTLLEIKESALKAVVTTPALSGDIDKQSLKAIHFIPELVYPTVKKDIRFLAQTLEMHKETIGKVNKHYESIFFALQSLRENNSVLTIIRDSLDFELQRIEQITINLQPNYISQSLQTLQKHQQTYLQKPDADNLKTWQASFKRLKDNLILKAENLKTEIDVYDKHIGLAESSYAGINRNIDLFNRSVDALEPLLTELNINIKKANPVFVQDISFFRDKKQRMQLLFILVAFLIINATLFYIIWNFSSQLKNLLKIAKEVEKGNFEARYDSQVHSEISLLGFAYNSMLDTIKNDREIITRNQLELEDKVKQRTMELEKAKEIAEAASMAKSDFLAKMSHEIRTPLNGIIGTAEVLLKSGISQQQADLVHIIYSSGTSLLQIINDILNYSTIESGKLELHNYHFSLRKLIDSVVTQFKLELVKKRINLVVNIDKTLPDLYIGDTGKIKQVLINIIVNAIKFTHIGDIIVTVKSKSEQHPYREILFSIADCGVGIPDDKLVTIFDSFTQVDNTATREYGGTGLGTTISKKLVELMGGKIWVISPNPDKTEDIGGPGSIFNFYVKLEHTEDYFIELNNDISINIRDITLVVLTQNKELLQDLSDIFSYNWIKPIHCDNVEDVWEIVEPTISEGKNIIVLSDYQIYRQENMEEILKLLRNSNISILAMIPAVISTTDTTMQSFGITHTVTLPIRQSVFLDKITEILNERYTHLGNKQIKAISKRIMEKPLYMLLAEDNPINQKVALVIFETLGFTIDIANNGEEAVQKAKDKEYDLIFMDIQMPLLNGMDATKQLRELGITTPIIAMTANAITGDKENYLSSGMNDYISKPITYNSITEMIKKWIFLDIDIVSAKDNRDFSHDKGAEFMQYPILNEQEAIGRVYDKDLLKELLVDFTNMKELDWSIFEKCLSEHNVQDIDRISHSIKGVAGNLALTGIFHSATELNNSVKLGELELVKRHFEELKLEVVRFRAFLPEYLKS